MNKGNNNEVNIEETIGRDIRRAALDIQPDRLLLRRVLNRAMISSRPAQPSFKRTLSGWVSIWRLSLPAVAIIVLIALGAWQNRASILILSQGFSDHQGNQNASGQAVPQQASVPTATIPSGDSNADLNQDMSVVSSKLNNINSDSSALDQSLGSKSSAQ